MHRRAGPSAAQRFISLVALVLVALVALGPGHGASASAPASASVSASVSAADDPGVDDPTPVTVSDFYPETANLSDCVGLVEKPGCGSKARGGWRQFAVFAAIVAGLGVIVWRVLAGLRANRRRESDSDGDAIGSASPTRPAPDTSPTTSQPPSPPTSSQPPSSSTPPSGRTTP